MSNVVNHDSPYIKRYLAWSSERFPAANVIGGIFTFLTISIIARLSLLDKYSFSYFDILGTVVYIGQLFVLRVYDEHKDFEVDKVNHPERALQRGLITLGQLRVFAFIFIALQLIWCYFSANPKLSFITWFGMSAYSLLMAKEFFIGEWLEKRLVLYATTHMIVSPMIIFWAITTISGTIEINNVIIYTLLFALFSGFAYEITRKTRGRDEDVNLDAYSKIMGEKGATFTIITFNLLTLIFSRLIITNLFNAGWISQTVLFVMWALCLLTNLKYLKETTEKSRKKNEGIFGLFILSIYIVIISLNFIG